MPKNLLYRLTTASGLATRIVDMPLLARGIAFVPNLSKLFFVVEHPTNGLIGGVKSDNTLESCSVPGSVRQGRGLVAKSALLISEDQQDRFRAIHITNGSIKNIIGSRGRGHFEGFRPRTSQAVHKLNGFALNKQKNSILYVSPEHHMVFVLNNDSLVDSVIGTGTPGFCIASNPLHNMLHTPTGITVVADGRIFIADKGNHVVREFMQENGIVVGRTIGIPETPGQQDGRWQQVSLRSPSAVTSDSKHLYLVDDNGHKIKTCHLDSMEVTTVYQTTGNIQYLTNGKPGEIFFTELTDGE